LAMSRSQVFTSSLADARTASKAGWKKDSSFTFVMKKHHVCFLQNRVLLFSFSTHIHIYYCFLFHPPKQLISNSPSHSLAICFCIPGGLRCQTEWPRCLVFVHSAQLFPRTLAAELLLPAPPDTVQTNKCTLATMFS
jgi:hypothetical protein